MKIQTVGRVESFGFSEVLTQRTLAQSEQASMHAWGGGQETEKESDRERERE